MTAPITINETGSPVATETGTKQEDLSYIERAEAVIEGSTERVTPINYAAETFGRSQPIED